MRQVVADAADKDGIITLSQLVDLARDGGMSGLVVNRTVPSTEWDQFARHVRRERPVSVRRIPLEWREIPQCGAGNGELANVAVVCDDSTGFHSRHGATVIAGAHVGDDGRVTVQHEGHEAFNYSMHSLFGFNPLAMHYAESDGLAVASELPGPICDCTRDLDKVRPNDPALVLATFEAIYKAGRVAVSVDEFAAVAKRLARNP